MNRKPASYFGFVFFTSCILSLILVSPAIATHEKSAPQVQKVKAVGANTYQATNPVTAAGKWIVDTTGAVIDGTGKIAGQIVGSIVDVTNQVAASLQSLASWQTPPKKVTATSPIGQRKAVSSPLASPLLQVAKKPEVLADVDDLTKLEERVAVLETSTGGFSSLSNVNTTSDNLMRNSSFESVSGTEPRQWKYQLDSASGNTFSSEEGNRSGKYGLKFKGGGTGLFGMSQPEAKTVPGRSYTLSTYLKVVSSPSITVKLGFWDEQNNRYATMKEFTYSGTKDWFRINMAVTTTGVITDLKNWFPMIEVRSLTTGNVYVEDMQLEEGSVMTTYNSATAKSGSTSGFGDGSIIANSNGNLHPSQHGVGSLGTSSERWEDLYISDDASIGDGLTVDGDVAINGDDLNSDGNLTIAATGYVRVGDAGTPNVADGDDELYVLGDIETDGNLNVAGTLTVAAGQAVTTDSIDITPSTNIDALDILGTNITTASLIDLDPTGTTTGNIIDIDTSTAHSGHVISVDNTGDAIWTGNVIDVTTGTGDASGDVLKMTFEAGATDVQGIVVANAAASDQAGWLMKVDTTGIFTTNMIDIDLGAQLSTGDIMNVSMGSTNVGGGVLVVADAGGARTDALIDLTSASTGDGNDAAALLQLNSTGVLLSGSNILDINRSGGAASNVIDITTSGTASGGNLIDLNFGVITDTGDAINIALGATATGAQAIVVTSGVMTRSVDLVSITDSGTSSGDTIEVALTGATTGHGLFLNNDAMVATGNVLYIDSDADRSSTSLLVIDDIADDTASAPTVDINLTLASDQPIINIDTAASNGSVIDINHTLADVTVQTYLLRGTYTDTADAEADFLLFEDNAADAQFLIAQDGNTTITGSGDGTAALTLTTGDLTVSDGDLTVSGGDVNLTTDAGDTLNIAKGAAPTADVVLIAAGSPATTNVDALNITMTTTDQTDITNSLVNMVLTSGGTAATDIARGIFIDLASTAGGNDTAIEIENTAAWDIDIALQFDEQIVNSTDDMVDFIGAAGSDNTDLRIDLDGTRPVFSSVADTIIEFAEDVEISGSNLFLALDNEASRDFALCVAADDGGATPGTTLQEVDDCDTAVTADYAERYPVENGTEHGDVLVIGSKYITSTTGKVVPQLIKSNSRYQKTLIGVASDNYHDFTSAGGDIPKEENQIAVALVGRVPVKVTSENGSIQPGDYLTTSSTPGYAMRATKAGSVVGMAMGSFSGDRGTVMTFVKATYYDPQEVEEKAVLAALSGGDVLGVTTNQTNVTPGATVTDVQSTDTLGVQETASSLLVEDRVTTSELSVTDLVEVQGKLTVTGLAQFGSIAISGNAVVGGNLEVSGAVVLETTADETITAGEAVYVSGSNRVKKATSSDVSRARVLGVAVNSANANEIVKVAVAGKVGGFTSLSVGQAYYLGNDGKLVSSVPADVKRVVQVGVAITDTQLVVQVTNSEPTVKTEVQLTETPKPVEATSTLTTEVITPLVSPSPESTLESTQSASPVATPAPSTTPIPQT